MHHLNEGDPAPAFEALDQEGRSQTLQDYSGQKLALYFYPKDNTPGCTNQACSLRDGMADLQKAGIKVLGVSINHAASHKKFMGREYDGTHRTTFCINEDGVIVSIIKKPKVKDHATEVLAAFTHER